MKSWLIIIVGLVTSCYFIDLKSEDTFQNTVCPILITLFIISLLYKSLASGGSRQGRAGHGGGYGGGGSFFGDFGGGDGGGGDGGGI